MGLYFKRGHLHVQLDWLLMNKLWKILLVLICCAAIVIMYTIASIFKVPIYRDQTWYGWGMDIFTLGSIIKYTVSTIKK